MKRYFTLVLLACLIPIFGCEQFISVEPPKNELLSEAVFQNEDQAIAALTSIYSDMYLSNSNSYRIAMITGLSGDELTSWSLEPLLSQVYHNSLEPISAVTNDFWNNAYNFIYRANAIIEGCEDSDVIGAASKRQISGEARFIRAFWYFYLTNLFNDVPLLVTTDYKDNAVASRHRKEQVYQQIIEDFTYAADNLNPQYINIKGQPYNERVRPNKFTALALLSRTYLYTEKWTNAAESASEVISETSLYDIVPLDEVFLKNSKNVIWQVLNPTTSVSDKSTIEATAFILTSRPFASSFQNCTSLSNQLLESFEAEDKRKDEWVNFYEDHSTIPSTNFYFPFKYKETSTSTPSEYSIYIRLGELYLIRAEAFARLGRNEDSLKDLNVIRKRAGLDPKLAVENDNLLDMIFQERTAELFCEFGHRWLDLKRRKRIDQVMERVGAVKGVQWNPDMQWWPIPQREIESNPNLEQNEGYK